MKRYKLLKDMPTIKAGTVFISDGTYVTQVDCDTKINIEDILNFNDWFEEIKEFEEWKPERYYSYKYLDDWGGVSSRKYGDLELNEFAISTGNCYPLDTPDELIIKEQKLIPQALHRLKMAAKKAWFDFNWSDGPDWSNRFQEKWKLSYDHSTNIFFSTVNRIEQSGNLLCFPTEKSAQAYIDNNIDDLKLLFGVE